MTNARDGRNGLRKLRPVPLHCLSKPRSKPITVQLTIDHFHVDLKFKSLCVPKTQTRAQVMKSAQVVLWLSLLMNCASSRMTRPTGSYANSRHSWLAGRSSRSPSEPQINIVRRARLVPGSSCAGINGHAQLHSWMAAAWYQLPLQSARLTAGSANSVTALVSP